MKTFHILSLAAITFLATSCVGTNQEKDKEEKTEHVFETINKETGERSLRAYEQEDTITIKGTLYNYKFKFTPVDSLQHVINSQGLKYLDNRVDLSISRDSSVVIKKTFLKTTFKSYVPEKIWEGTGLVGFSYNFVRSERDAFYFIATIGDPDETADISYPLEIRLTTDGGMTIEKAQNLDTEPLREGLNIDPSEDDGV